MKRRVFDLLVSGIGVLLVVIASFCLGFIMAVLVAFGFRHARRTPAEAELLRVQPEPTAV